MCVTQAIRRSLPSWQGWPWQERDSKSKRESKGAHMKVFHHFCRRNHDTWRRLLKCSRNPSCWHRGSMDRNIQSIREWLNHRSDQKKSALSTQTTFDETGREQKNRHEKSSEHPSNEESVLEYHRCMCISYIESSKAGTPLAMFRFLLF